MTLVTWIFFVLIVTLAPVAWKVNRDNNKLWREIRSDGENKKDSRVSIDGIIGIELTQEKDGDNVIFFNWMIDTKKGDCNSLPIRREKLERDRINDRKKRLGTDSEKV